MSYAFTVYGPTKADALNNAAAALDAVVASEPGYAAERTALMADATRRMATLADPEGPEQVLVAMAGQVSASPRVTSSMASCTVGLVPIA